MLLANLVKSITCVYLDYTEYAQPPCMGGVQCIYRWFVFFMLNQQATSDRYM